MKIFRSARLRLTMWYSLIITIVCIMFSTLLYISFSNELVRLQRTQLRRIQKTQQFPPRGLSDEVIVHLNNRMKIILALINSGLVGLSAFAAFFLAGKTLQPIQTMVENQEAFIANASHQMRTPLTAMQTQIEVNLRDARLTLAQARTLLQDNLIDIHTLKLLSDKLLHISQTNYQEPFTKINLTQLIKQVIKQLKPLAKHKQIKFIEQLNSVQLNCAPEQMKELITILLDNALKYSSSHSEVQIKLYQQKNKVVITVADQGVGIDPLDLPHIFERFYRAKSNLNHTSPGYGLGLSIAHQIVQNHRGKIQVQSKPNQGTQIEVQMSTS